MCLKYLYRLIMHTLSKLMRELIIRITIKPPRESMNQLPKFSANGWRRLSNGILQHVSGAEFKKAPNGTVEITKDSLAVYIQNLKQEGVGESRAKTLLLKLAQQAEQHLVGLH